MTQTDKQVVELLFEAGDEVGDIRWDKLVGMQGMYLTEMWNGTLILCSKEYDTEQVRLYSSCLEVIVVQDNEDGDTWERHELKDIYGYRFEDENKVYILRSVLG